MLTSRTIKSYRENTRLVRVVGVNIMGVQRGFHGAVMDGVHLFLYARPAE